jgi:predicted Fe-Mo cluster-binding NifX family protein
MKIVATAIEVNSKDTLLSSCFGNAKYYAFFDGDNLTIERNSHRGGASVLKWLKEKEVTHLLIKDMGKVPCAYKKKKHPLLIYPKNQKQPKLNEIVQSYFLN